MENKKQKSFFARSLIFFKPFWGSISLVVGLMLIGQTIATFSPYLFGKSVDAVTHHNIKNAFIFLGYAFGVSLLQANILIWIREHIEISRLDDHIEKSFSVKSLSRMFEFSVGQHINEHSGVKQSVVSRGQNSLTQLMFNSLYNLLPNVIQVIVTLGIVAFFDYHVALLAGSFVVLYVSLSLRRNKKMIPIIEEMRKKHQAQSKLQSELFRNSTLVITEAQEERTRDEFQRSAEEVSNFSTKNWLTYLKSYYKYKFLVQLGQYSSISLGVYFILMGKHSVGMFIALFAWISAIFSNLTQIMSTQRHILLQLAEIRKYYDLLDIMPDINVNENGQVLENLQGKIEFKNVSFAYPYRTSALKEQEENEDDTKKNESEDAISDVSFVIPAGAKVGFVGQSGSGKSTIVNLMRRYYDATSGNILIDDVPLKAINLKWLRGKIGNVEQKIELFDRSIKENILFGLPEGGGERR